MRPWSIHSCYLDSKGLAALWRQGLLAQSVLLENTRGYKNPPQLKRFKNTDNPICLITGYLRHILDDVDKRSYNFNRKKIANSKFKTKLPVTNGQIEFEFKQLLKKLKERDPDLYKPLKWVKRTKVHPAFKKISGDEGDWEII